MTAREILRQALSEVEAAQIPEHLQSIAFAKALELLDPTPPSPQAAGKPARGASAEPHTAPSSGIASLAEKLKLPDEAVGEVFHMEGDQLEVVLASSKLDSSKSGATRELSLLVAGGRQLSGLEEWTSTDVIRDVAEHFGKYDPANFARSVRGMEDEFSFRGKSRSLEVRVNRKGQEDLRNLVAGLVGVGGD